MRRAKEEEKARARRLAEEEEWKKPAQETRKRLKQLVTASQVWASYWTCPWNTYMRHSASMTCGAQVISGCMRHSSSMTCGAQVISGNS